MKLSAFFTEQVWTGKGLVAFLLGPVSWLTKLWLIRQDHLYLSGKRESVHVPVPVLVVGNVLVGGTGKTPVVISLVQHFQKLGLQVGVIARAYGTSDESVREVVTADTQADAAGDEALLIKRRCQVPVFIGRQRAQAALALLRAYPATRLLISDDGMQHRGLHHDLAVCVFDDRGLGNGWLLPAGPLRESWPRKLAPDVKQYLLHTAQQSFENSLPAKRYLSHIAINGLGQQRLLSSWINQPVQALAGIARPDLFFEALKNTGLVLANTYPLQDHAPLSNWRPSNDLPVLCTEKDAVKLWPHLPEAWAVPLECELPGVLLDEITSDVQQLSLKYGHQTA
jgi:tetraacyldisaccharide 4'-kinase